MEGIIIQLAIILHIVTAGVINLVDGANFTVASNYASLLTKCIATTTKPTNIIPLLVQYLINNSNYSTV